MGQCDNLVADLTPVAFNVAISTDPCYDVSIVQAGVTMSATTLAGQGPPGPQGDKGDQGDPGAQGDPGPSGTQGLPGAAATIAVGATVTGAPGSAATVTNSGSSSAATFDFSIPAGVQGTQGATGPIGNAATIAVGTTTTGSPGTNAAVNNSGSSSAAVFNFTIPAGVQGVQGPVGPVGPTGPGTGDMLKSTYDTNNDGIVDHAALADTAPWTGITGKPASFTPSAHETTHLDNGSDPIPLASTTRTGLSPQIPATNPTKQFHRGDNTYAQANYPDLTNIPASFAPSAHAPSHVTGGADIIPVVTSSATGLVPVLPADVTKYLRGDGTFARTAVSADAGNIATLGSDNLISVPQSSLWSMRLRSFNAIGNPTFEVDQINVGNTVANANGKIIDRWFLNKAGTVQVSDGRNSVAAGINIPGTSFAISRSFNRVTLTTAEPALGAGDYVSFLQNVEGPSWRELQNDVHSLQVLVRSSVANLVIGISLTDPAAGHSLTNTLTLGAANTWVLLTLPNLPVWTGAGNFVNTPGNVGYVIYITLACGTTYTSPANGTWQNALYLGAIGQSNFAASPVNSTFDIAFIQHEPGAVCSTPMDCPFTQNYDACLRYYQKTYSYATALGTTGTAGTRCFIAPSSVQAWGANSFAKPMAKIPTMTLYNHGTGAAGSVQDSAAVNHASATVSALGDSGFASIAYTTATTSTMPVYFHYTADTGW